MAQEGIPEDDVARQLFLTGGELFLASGELLDPLEALVDPGARHKAVDLDHGFLVNKLLAQPIDGGLVDLAEGDALRGRARGVERDRT
jgi:hypothetical protein